MTLFYRNIQISLIIVGAIWAVFVLNLFLPYDLRMYGLRPRQISSLQGILFMPFLHGNLTHLIANTGTLLVLLVASLSFSRKLTLFALLVIFLIGGGLVWLFGGPNTVHIGASGIIFGLIGFLMFIGFFRREWKSLAVSFVIFLFYGGALLSLMTYMPGISWTGHLFGFLSGILAAWWSRQTRIATKDRRS